VQAGRRRYAQGFAWDAFGARLRELLATLLASRAARGK